MRADVVVVGGGIIGCAVARELTRRRVEVLLVEPREVGGGATAASAGMLVPYVEAPEHGSMLELGVRSLAMYDEFVAEVQQETGAAFEYVREGSLQVALRDDPVLPMQNAARQHKASGVAAEWLDEADLWALEPHLSTDIVGGLLIRPHGLVAATPLTRALWRAAEALGARHVPQTALRLLREDDGVAIQTSAERISAKRVVLAAGCWGADIEIDGGLAVPVRPVRGQLVEMKWPAPPLGRILWGPRCYVVPWRDGSALVGATVENVGYDERNTIAGVWDLIEAATNLLPPAWRATFVAARAGLRPETPDQMPIIGASRRWPAVVFATGHYRNGVLLAPITARLVADLVVDLREDPLLGSLAPGRFGG